MTPFGAKWLFRDADELIWRFRWAPCCMHLISRRDSDDRQLGNWRAGDHAGHTRGDHQPARRSDRVDWADTIATRAHARRDSRAPGRARRATQAKHGLKPHLRLEF